MMATLHFDLAAVTFDVSFDIVEVDHEGMVGTIKNIGG